MVSLSKLLSKKTSCRWFEVLHYHICCGVVLLAVLSGWTIIPMPLISSYRIWLKQFVQNNNKTQIMCINHLIRGMFPCCIEAFPNPTSEWFIFHIYHKRIYFTYINDVSLYVKTVPILLGHHNHQLHLSGVQTTPNAIFHSGEEHKVTATN